MKTQLKRIWYWGRKHYCNLCSAHVRSWIWVGLNNEVFNRHNMVGAGRRKRGCPVCHGTDRDRLMRHFFETQWDILFQDQQPQILHFAPETYLTDLLSSSSSLYVKGDFFTPGYQYTPDTVQMDIQHIPHPDNSWDMVIANHVLEHVQNDTQAMRELYRVIKPGGIAIVQVPISLDLYETIEVDDTENLNYEEITGQFDHKRLYGLDYLNRLIGAGFNLEFWADLDQVDRLGFHPEERIVIARKKEMA